MDLPAAAHRIVARFSGEKLTLKVLGKDFGIDSRGNLYADIHVNPWVAIPFLTYILYSKGLAPSGRWVSFRELKDGRERYPLFRKRCEDPLKQVADAYTPLFDDMVHLFGGKQVERQFASDISVVLHPLPRVPIMVCYWLPAQGTAIQPERVLRRHGGRQPRHWLRSASAPTLAALMFTVRSPGRRRFNVVWRCRTPSGSRISRKACRMKAITACGPFRYAAPSCSEPLL